LAPQRQESLQPGIRALVSELPAQPNDTKWRPVASLRILKRLDRPGDFAGLMEPIDAALEALARAKSKFLPAS